MGKMTFWDDIVKGKQMLFLAWGNYCQQSTRQVKPCRQFILSVNTYIFYSADLQTRKPIPVVLAEGSMLLR